MWLFWKATTTQYSQKPLNKVSVVKTRRPHPFVLLWLSWGQCRMASTFSLGWHFDVKTLMWHFLFKAKSSQHITWHLHIFLCSGNFLFLQHNFLHVFLVSITLVECFRSKPPCFDPNCVLWKHKRLWVHRFSHSWIHNWRLNFTITAAELMNLNLPVTFVHDC